MTAPATLDDLLVYELPTDHSACETCWYCEAPLSTCEGGHEHEHVIPRRHNGPIIVPACPNCHNLKDRTPLHSWSATEVVRFVHTVPAGPQRVLWAKLVGLLWEAE